MNYSEDFKELIKKSAERLEINEADNTFIGAGNPNGKILFIGQECAIGEAKNPEKQIIQDHLYYSEVILHIRKWCKNIWEDISQEEVVEARCIEDYNPLFPYKGKKVLRFVEGKNNGIASTWYYYQKLYDAILGNPDRSNRSTLVDFFEDCFMTELSHITAKNNKEANKKKILRKASIDSRKELFKEPFFQSFPIVIVAAGHYPYDNGFDMQEIFGVQWTGCSIKIGKKFVNIHHGVNSPKLLIHTNQFSCTNNEQITNIAELCQQFIDDNNIELKNQQAR